MGTSRKPLLRGTIAEYHGHLFRASSRRHDPEHRILRSFPGDDVSDVPGFAPEEGGPTWVGVVDLADLDALYADSMSFHWRRQPFSVIRIIDDNNLEGYYRGGDGGWAQKNGLSGDQYSGYTRKFKTGEVDDLVVERKDFLTGRTERREP